MYGIDEGERFIATQLFDCYGLSNSHDNAVGQQIKAYAGIFCSCAKSSKMSEIALFFGRFSVGIYERKANFSTREIGQSWNTFKNDWLQECGDYAENGEEVKPTAPSLVHKNAYEHYLRTTFYANNDRRQKVRECCQKLLESTLVKGGTVPFLNYEQRKAAEEYIDEVFQADDANGGVFSVIASPESAGGKEGFYKYGQ